MSGTPRDVTRLLEAHRQGDKDAFDSLVALVYDELRNLARRWRRAPGATLNTTALLHEAYINLVGQDGGWNDRGHFFAAASRVMRHVAVDHARWRHRQKRGGDRVQTDLQEAHAAVTAHPEAVLAIDRALAELEAHSPRTVRVVECRYFAGLTTKETAATLGVSVSTVEAEWRSAREHLERRLTEVRP